VSPGPLPRRILPTTQHLSVLSQLSIARHCPTTPPSPPANSISCPVTSSNATVGRTKLNSRRRESDVLLQPWFSSLVRPDATNSLKLRHLGHRRTQVLLAPMESRRAGANRTRGPCSTRLAAASGSLVSREISLARLAGHGRDTTAGFGWLRDGAGSEYIKRATAPCCSLCRPGCPRLVLLSSPNFARGQFSAPPPSASGS
jgi:hypothetical protein